MDKDEAERLRNAETLRDKDPEWFDWAVAEFPKHPERFDSMHAADRVELIGAVEAERVEAERAEAERLGHPLPDDG